MGTISSEPRLGALTMSRFLHLVDHLQAERNKIRSDEELRIRQLKELRQTLLRRSSHLDGESHILL